MPEYEQVRSSVKGIAWIAPADYEADLKDELQRAGFADPELQNWGRVFFLPLEELNPTAKRNLPAIYWAQDIWSEAELINFDSAKDAARILRRSAKLWSPIKDYFYHRCGLIASKLPTLPESVLEFPQAVRSLKEKPDNKTAAFCLIEQHRMLFSTKRTNPFPALDPCFKENKKGPPSRAYLKLWEVFTRLGRLPEKGARCMDMGAAPGGWSWVLAESGCHVRAVDRAPLSDDLMKRPNIKFQKGNAFAVQPEQVGKLDWLVSDLICEPAKLYDWLQIWLQDEHCKNFVCTLKMKGKADYETTRKFATIPGSQIIHLFHNKHELTWILLRD